MKKNAMFLKVHLDIWTLASTRVVLQYPLIRILRCPKSEKRNIEQQQSYNGKIRFYTKSQMF